MGHSHLDRQGPPGYLGAGYLGAGPAGHPPPHHAPSVASPFLIRGRQVVTLALVVLNVTLTLTVALPHAEVLAAAHVVPGKPVHTV